MTRFILIAVLSIFSVIGFGQVPDGDVESMSPAEKMLLKMMFKSFETPALSDVFDTVSEEVNIKEFSSSKFESMGLIAVCFTENEDLDFSTEDSDEFDRSTFTYGKLKHYSGNSIRYIQAVTNDKKEKVCEYIVTVQEVTFLIIYKASISDFSKGVNEANNVSINVKRK